MEIGIYINSANRADRVLTIRQFPASWKRITYIVVPESQADSYRHYGWPVLPIPKSVPSFLPPQRQWVMEHAKCDYVFLMDDDLTFEYRYQGLLLKKSDNTAMERMFADTLKFMETYPLVGISQRYGNNFELGSVQKNCKVTRCYCVNKSVFLKNKFNLAPFNDFVAEDLYISLEMLKAGYPTRILFNYAQDHKARNQEGGCSLYRTLDVEEKSSKYMALTYPGVVKIQVKKRKGGWGKPIGNGMTMTIGMRVSWNAFRNVGLLKERRIAR